MAWIFFPMLLQLFAGLLTFWWVFLTHFSHSIKKGSWEDLLKKLLKCEGLRTWGLYLLQAQYTQLFLLLFLIFLFFFFICTELLKWHPMYKKQYFFSSHFVLLIFTNPSEKVLYFSTWCVLTEMAPADFFWFLIRHFRLKSVLEFTALCIGGVKT